ncbi:Transcriptional regulator, MerR family [hydrothermal vent metagenome]|uniref:Transcriptional regulator, MerR family n=1 Tax=hydrothermal vent metagenome TaxID=652676 RepID=A0A1W1E8T7_9ZZZZ
MALKMKELMLRSGESKSTILYYVKEGLLPEPSKPKPNVHLYDESAVEITKLIKYLQHNFSYSISEIKAIFAQNRFESTESFKMLVSALELISGSKEMQRYSREDFLEITGVDEKTLKGWIEAGIVFERPYGFGEKEVEIVQILMQAASLGLDFALIETYVESAKMLAKKEFESGAEMMRQDPDAHTQHYALFFDLILTLKPYLFNMHTVAEYRKQYANDEKGQS